MNGKDLHKQRYGLVVKSNDLIRESRYSLSVVEQRIVLYLISRIKKDASQILDYDFDIKDFCQICGIAYESNLSQLKANILELSNKGFWFWTSETKRTTCRWISKATLDYGKSILTIRLDNDLLPYLLQLKANFTSYQLIAILAMKSKFSIRLYEILKSYQYLGKWEVSISDLRAVLLITDEYKETKYFIRDVINKSLDEINRYTDLAVEYQTCRECRTIAGFIFTIQEADGFDGKYRIAERQLDGKAPSRNKLNHDLRAVLDDGQVSLFEESDK